jgi:hypothetical protein
MATHVWGKGHIQPFWDDQYRRLNYTKKAFNNPEDMVRWRQEGYTHSDELFTGYLCDMNSPLPNWTAQLINWFADYFGVTDIGCSYYRMTTGTVLPLHSDTYNMYRQMFGCETKNIIRALVMPEAWASGHYLEIGNTLIPAWHPGSFYWWEGNTPHMAANIGVADRYTIQLTGHRVE